MIGALNSAGATNVAVIEMNGQTEEAHENHIAAFNYSKRTARYLTEYMFKLFSMFIASAYPTEELLDRISIEKRVIEFRNKCLKVDESVVYGDIGITFDKDAPFVFQAGTHLGLIANSHEMAVRLIYSLVLFAERNRAVLLRYAGFANIQNYYLDVTDYRQGRKSKGGWLLVPVSAVRPLNLSEELDALKDIGDVESRLTLSDELVGGTYAPYIMVNRAIEGGRGVIAQNTDTIERALAVGVAWSQTRINRGLGTPALAANMTVPYTLYLASGDGPITSVHINPELGQPVAAVAVVKREVIQYTALLPL